MAAQVNGTCLIAELCCGIDCCDPSVECCDGGLTCTSKASISCNTCQYDGVDDECNCIPKDNGCTGAQFACGTGCCDLGFDTCSPSCECIPL